MSQPQNFETQLIKEYTDSDVLPGAQFVGSITATKRGEGYVDLIGTTVSVHFSEGKISSAVSGDIVLFTVTAAGSGEDKPEAVVDEVLKRRRTKFVGIIHKAKQVGFVIADDKKMHTDIFLPPQEASNLNENDKVEVEVIDWGDGSKNPQGKVLQVFGQSGDHEAEMASILADSNIDTSFPGPVKKEAEEIAASGYKETRDTDEGRVDVTHITTFTIDPADAKDFDDAISVETLSDTKKRVGVHIADVSHFVRPGSALDHEARQRAYSTYLVDRTIPMLPEELSNNLCSLNPNEEKRSFSVFADIENNQISNIQITRTRIKSDRRFTYEDAQAVLDAGDGDFIDELTYLNDTAKVFSKQRQKEGALDFDTEEVKFRLDENGKPTAVFSKDRLDTHRLVEEFMLMANRLVAEYMTKQIAETNAKTFIYRIHDTPNQERLDTLQIFLNALDHKLDQDGDGEISAKDLQMLFKEIEGEPAEQLIKTAAVRTMSKAVYATKNIGHFGLAFKNYTHFTSPIRRYADLVSHRLLWNRLTGKAETSGQFESVTVMCAEISQKEGDVTQAERESIKLKQVEYMSEHLNEPRRGIISGVTEWGIYVEDDETKAEGMVRLRDLDDDHYELDKETYTVVGQTTKKKYTLGDNVTFQATKADVIKRILDMKLVTE